MLDRRSPFPLLAALISALLAALSAQAPKPVPLAKAMEQLQAQLQTELERHRIDPARDNLSTIQEKRKAIAKALEDFTNATSKLTLREYDLGIDHTRLIEATTPRLSGAVVTVGTNQDFDDLESALGDAREGTLVLLGPGEHQLPKDIVLYDMLLVGMGQTQTVLRGTLRNAHRVKFSNLKVRCNNIEILNIRDGQAAQFEKCLVEEYNSGLGGSNAIFCAGATLYLQDCEFEGDSGNLAGKNRYGTALDLRDMTYLLARGTLFRDNSEIVRATGFCVIDDCRALAKRRTSGISKYPEGFLLVRKLACPTRGEPQEFTFATDDRAVVQHLAGRKSKIDAATLAALDRMQLGRSPRYWATLLQHAHKEVRFIAQGQLRSLLRSALPKFVLNRKAVARLPKEMQQPFTDALRSSHALRWLDENEEKLVWNPKLKSYKFDE